MSRRSILRARHMKKAGFKMTNYLRIRENDPTVLFILKSFLMRFIEENVFTSAAALSYYLIFSFFPFILFLNSVLGMAGVGIREGSILFAILPQEVSDLMTAYLDQLTVTNNLPFLIGGLFSAVYLLTRAVNSLNYSLNNVYRVSQKRSPVKSYLLSAVFCLALFLMIIAGVVFSVVSTDIVVYISRFISIPQGFIELWGLIKWLVIILLFFFALASLYFFMPYVRIGFFSVVPGTLFAGTGMILSSVILSYMAKNVFRYSVIYGSLTAVIILMLWLYVVSLVIISGGILNYVLTRAKKRSARA